MRQFLRTIFDPSLPGKELFSLSNSPGSCIDPQKSEGTDNASEGVSPMPAGRWFYQVPERAVSAGGGHGRRHRTPRKQHVTPRSSSLTAVNSLQVICIQLKGVNLF